MTVKSTNWSNKLRKARLPITRRLTRLVIYPCGSHAHSLCVVILYLIGSLLCRLTAVCLGPTVFHWNVKRMQVPHYTLFWCQISTLNLKSAKIKYANCENRSTVKIRWLRKKTGIQCRHFSISTYFQIPHWKYFLFICYFSIISIYRHFRISTNISSQEISI